MNAVLPPAAAGACMERYAWALENGVGRLHQLRRGHALEQEQMDAYIDSSSECSGITMRTLTRWCCSTGRATVSP